MRNKVRKVFTVGVLAIAMICTIWPYQAQALTYTGAPAGTSFDESYYGKFRDKNMSISVYNWGEYIGDGSDESIDVCKAFTEVTGIKIYYTNFATNEELYAKLKSGASGYDVIIPSDYMIARMIEEDMLLPLNKDNIPNLKYLDDKFTDPQYDPGSLYSVPYAWNTVALIYNTKLIDDVVDSWDILWDEKYKGQILMFSNSRDAFAIACKKLGYSLNTENEQELREAADLLIQQKSLVQAYVMDQIFDKMENNEAAVAPYYAGDAVLMLDNNPDLAVAYPKEGTNLFVDAAAIPEGARNKEAAEMFINFLNEPIVASENMQYIGYATPNWAAYELLPEEMKQDEITYPPQNVIDTSEQFIHLSPETNALMDGLWTKILAENKSFWVWGFPPLFALALIVLGKTMYKAKKKRDYKEMVQD